MKKVTVPKKNKIFWKQYKYFNLEQPKTEKKTEHVKFKSI